MCGKSAQEGFLATSSFVRGYVGLCDAERAPCNHWLKHRSREVAQERLLENPYGEDAEDQ